MSKTLNPSLHDFKHRSPIQIRFNDIDQLSHVTNSVYQQYFDLGRLNYFTDVFEEQMDWESKGLILASITINYLQPIKMWDKIEVLSRIVEIGNKSLRMEQKILNHSMNSIAAESQCVMVCYSNSLGETIKIPENWQKRIIAFENSVKLRVKI
ncbi:MAG: acyl-CoA thioester hydrolase [Tenuifilum sp.]|jgi:acyl-CoA thioester hydrolase|uniref:acyl-CoA thioesterase n=1 Tax=Tenuifilum sp. TaxID=2760880 RepID=UPI0024AC4421|nr:acyl-CoA thioesterase [Tenuifilum sp.]MDI3526032.1 acyl-CoA thioester hydrolase [Tenuifilum sp.]